MSFCKYCGRQLQDGEVCTCQQQPQQAPVQQAAPQQTMGGAAQPQQGFNQQAAHIPAGSRSADISAGTAGI